jgi:hypothetical protein
MKPSSLLVKGDDRAPVPRILGRQYLVSSRA